MAHLVVEKAKEKAAVKKEGTKQVPPAQNKKTKPAVWAKKETRQEVWAKKTRQVVWAEKKDPLEPKKKKTKPAAWAAKRPRKRERSRVDTE